jgi:hypothetical protein
MKYFDHSETIDMKNENIDQTNVTKHTMHRSVTSNIVKDEIINVKIDEFKCQQCFIIFTSERNLRYHTRASHSNVKLK